MERSGFANLREINRVLGTLHNPTSRNKDLEAPDYKIHLRVKLHPMNSGPPLYGVIVYVASLSTSDRARLIARPIAKNKVPRFVISCSSCWGNKTSVLAAEPSPEWFSRQGICTSFNHEQACVDSGKFKLRLAWVDRDKQ